MKKLPSEQELLEVLELCRIAEQKARKLHEMGLEMSAKWRMMREVRLATPQQEGRTEKMSAG